MVIQADEIGFHIDQQGGPLLAGGGPPDGALIQKPPSKSTPNARRAENLPDHQNQSQSIAVELGFRTPKGVMPTTPPLHQTHIDVPSRLISAQTNSIAPYRSILRDMQARL